MSILIVLETFSGAMIANRVLKQIRNIAADIQLLRPKYGSKIPESEFVIEPFTIMYPG